MVNRQTILEVLLENRQEVMLYEVINRHISLDGFDRRVLVGVRRAGKSYLLFGHIQNLVRNGVPLEQIVYINFEDERLANLQLEDLNSILEIQASINNNRPILFFDEIQNVDGWEKFARRLADQKYSVFITGSNAKMLSQDVASTLGGRFLTTVVFPFSFEEFLKINGKEIKDPYLLATTGDRARFLQLYEEYFQFGGFPECATLPAKRDYLMSLYQKIFLGDIAARNRIENLFALKTLIRKIAESVNQPISFTRATNIVASTGTKIGKNTVINYIEYAKEACLLFSITNIADNLTERVSNPKYYFIDNGIISLLALDIRTSLLENMIALALIRKYGSKDAVFYYINGVEVDFYIPEAETAIQVSYSIKNSTETFSREVKALNKISERLVVKRKLIITFDEEDYSGLNEHGIEIIPAWKFIANL